MAKFNPDNTSGEPTNFTGRSQGLPPNRAGELLLEGVGNVLQGAAKTKDFMIQQDIRQEVDDVFMDTNSGFRVDEKTGFDAVQDKSQVPDEFKDTADTFQSNLTRLQAARSQGSMTDSHYYSMLAYSMKNIKSKYPGYHEVVDNIFQQVTGVRPANAVHSAIRAEQQAALNDMESAGKDRTKLLESTREYWGRKWTYQQVMSGEIPFETVMDYTAQYEAEVKAVAAEKANLDLREKQGTVVDGDMTKLARRTATTITKQILDGAASKVGFDLKSTTSRLLELKNTVNPTPEAISAIAMEIQGARLAAEQELQEVLMRDYPNMDPAERNKIVKENTQVFQDMEDQIGGGKFDLAGQSARLLEMRSAHDVSIIQSNNPVAREVAAWMKLNPDLGQQALTLFRGKGDIVEVYGPHYLTVAAGGMMSVYDIMADINQNEKLPEADRNRLASEVVMNIDQMMMNPKMSDKDVLKFMSANFGGEKPPMGKVLELINRDGGGARKFFMDFSKPAIIDRLKGIKGEQGVEAVRQYSSFIANMVDDVPEVERIVSEAARSLEPDPGRLLDIQYDAAQGVFTTRVNPDNQAAAGDPVVVEALVKNQTKDLAQVNAVIKNFRYALTQAGMDPEAYIANYLRMKGVYVDPKGVGKATNPLGSTGAEDLSSLRLPTDGFEFASLLQEQSDDYLLAYDGDTEDEDGPEDLEMIPVIDAPKPPSFMAYAEAQDNPDDGAFAGLTGGTPGVRFNKEWQSTGMDPEFKSLLQKTSEELGLPLNITSGHRPSAYNRKVGGSRGSRHVVGDAADISMRGMSVEQRKLLVKTLIKNGAHRFITYSKSPDMIHVDTDKRFGKTYFMHDRSKANIRNAPAWMREINDELAMKDTDARLDELAAKYLTA